MNTENDWNHPPVSEIGRNGTIQPNFVGLRELEELLRFHSAPGHISLGNNRVKDRLSWPDPVGGMWGDLELPCALHTSGAAGVLVSHHRSGIPLRDTGTKTGVWLTMLPSTVNGTELGVHEWRDTIFLRYSIDTPDLTYHCGGCNSALYICHGLEYKKGSLITNRRKINK